MAVRTRVANRRAGALTGRTGLLNREKALLHADLTNTTASRTFDRLSAFLGAAAATGLTSNLGRYIDCYGIAANRFFETPITADQTPNDARKQDTEEQNRTSDPPDSGVPAILESIENSVLDPVSQTNSPVSLVSSLVMTA